MNRIITLLKVWKRFFGFLFFCWMILMRLPESWAQSSPLQIIQEKAKAVVTIQSVNATVLAGQPQGIFDKSTGRILILNKIRPVGYERSGSGVIIDPSGVIVTNAHTVTEAGGIAVTLFDGTRVFCKKVLVVPNTDIAFLAIDPPFALASISFAKPDKISEGASVYTIGHSEYIKGTLTGGRIIGIKREPINGAVRTSYLRVTFSVYKGDSGSPILDKKGDLLGIVAAGREGRDNATFAISSEVIELAYKTFCDQPKKEVNPKKS